MNRDEYYKSGDWFRCNNHNDFYFKVHKELKKWKLDNGIVGRCCVHHRTDTEETKKYNDEHYELWGCNPDGTFEHGKYVIFMTQSEHNTEHFTGHIYSKEYRRKMSESTRGEKNGMFGRTHSDETKRKISEANRGKLKGRSVPDEVMVRRKRSVDATSYLYAVYQNNGGSLTWNDFRHALRIGEIAFEKEYNNGKSVYINRDF